MPPDNDAVVIVNGFNTSSVNTLVVVRASASVTRTVIEVEPAADGVPEIVAALSVRPAGRVPDEIAHVNGPTPPAETSVCEYTEPTIPTDNDDVDTDNAVAAIEIVNALLAERPAASVALIVNDDTVLATAVGVPEITPVLVFNDTPPGRLPEATANV
jgi:hypothetical protein